MYIFYILIIMYNIFCKSNLPRFDFFFLCKLCLLFFCFFVFNYCLYLSSLTWPKGLHISFSVILNPSFLTSKEKNWTLTRARAGAQNKLHPYWSARSPCPWSPSYYIPNIRPFIVNLWSGSLLRCWLFRLAQYLWARHLSNSIYFSYHAFKKMKWKIEIHV